MQLINEIKYLQDVNTTLKEEINRLSNTLQVQSKQFTNERAGLLRQIQQLRSKINSMERICGHLDLW